MTTELMEKLKIYERTFGNFFPTIPLLETHSPDEAIQIINRCISEHKDVYELGYLTFDLYACY